ncbi:Hypothetical protein GLP15_67 [Giardia lamblia P15]|uniref:Uncharacterized protein n=1 Tax=Giardia intestinalis (strain P15) TaxID=658858 RepID=E1F8E6_GIAIA|nr:Hypothetical protein GLP15_67 [Giardia lamblia P15]
MATYHFQTKGMFSNYCKMMTTSSNESQLLTSLASQYDRCPSHEQYRQRRGPIPR